MILSQETCQFGTITPLLGTRREEYYDDLFIVICSIPGWKLIQVFLVEYCFEMEVVICIDSVKI